MVHIADDISLQTMKALVDSWPLLSLGTKWLSWYQVEHPGYEFEYFMVNNDRIQSDNLYNCFDFFGGFIVQYTYFDTRLSNKVKVCKFTIFH